ncbi:MAG: UpxY family transcription antiterminator [Marinilabiliaceae bacterium]|nr:UpxY family transcription antiterminator [Marinilabiliaceae bacterium]
MNSEKTENNWYALYTRSRTEKKVFEQFSIAGIESYLPMKKELRQWSDRKKWVEMPLINSYIFVKLPSIRLRDVYNIHGVVAFVNDNGKPAIIPNNQIDAMRRTIDNHLSFSVQSTQLEKGQTIKITSGPLVGIEGEILQIKGSKKLIIQVSHIGYTMIIDMANASFEPLDKTNACLS